MEVEVKGLEAFAVVMAILCNDDNQYFFKSDNRTYKCSIYIQSSGG